MSVLLLADVYMLAVKFEHLGESFGSIRLFFRSLEVGEDLL